MNAVYSVARVPAPAGVVQGIDTSHMGHCLESLPQALIHQTCSHSSLSPTLTESSVTPSGPCTDTSASSDDSSMVVSLGSPGTSPLAYNASCSATHAACLASLVTCCTSRPFCVPLFSGVHLQDHHAQPGGVLPRPPAAHGEWCARRGEGGQAAGRGNRGKMSRAVLTSYLW
jgi:hypothetical protein